MVRGGEEVDVEGRAHAGEFSAEGGVCTDVFGMGDCEVVEEGLEDGELGGERVGVAGAEGGAVIGVVVVLQAARGERRQAWGAAAVHGGQWHRVRCLLYNGCRRGCWYGWYGCVGIGALPREAMGGWRERAGWLPRGASSCRDGAVGWTL